MAYLGVDVEGAAPVELTGDGCSAGIASAGSGSGAYGAADDVEGSIAGASADNRPPIGSEGRVIAMLSWATPGRFAAARRPATDLLDLLEWTE